MCCLTRHGGRALLFVLLAATSLAAAAPAGAAGGSTSLPQIPSVVAPGQPCTARSTKSSDLTPWAQSMLRPAGVWQLTQGAGITVAVVDTGVDAGSGPLAGRVLPGRDVVSGGTAAGDCVGHGTFVAGLIAAARRDDSGFAGIAPQARVLAVRATSRQGATTAADLADGIRAAAEGGAEVIDVPLGVASGAASLTDAVRYATGRGALVVAAATMDGQQHNGAVYPAALPGVLAVSSLAPGGAADGTVRGAQPALAAPGASVMSVGPGGSGDFTGSGAGFASAFVAGTAALVDAYHPGLSPARLTARLEATANRPAGSLPDPQFGWGTVDPQEAVSALLTTSPTAARRSVVTMPRTHHDPAPRQSYLVAAAAAAVIAIVGLLSAVLPRGRRRGWRPRTARRPA